MATIRPFAAVSYARRPELDLSNLIAPPYDVLDERSQAALIAGHPRNITVIDLPHLPAKTVGPDAAYARATATLDAWLADGTLVQDGRAALYPYAQSYEHAGRTYHRRGFIALVKLSPFGAGDVIPHEKTYREAIEDRLKLTRATRVQLSPIFGLFSDPRNEVTNLLYKNLGRPEASGTLDGVKNDLWSVIDAEVENHVIDLMGTKPIYVADGHHRYTMALQYQFEMEQKNGGPLPPSHPANYCLFVLVGMQDPGLLILPTHRFIGNLAPFDVATFKAAVGGAFEVTESPLGPERMAEFADDFLKKEPPHTLGLFDGRTRKLHVLRLKDLDVLANLEPGQSDAWRRLDVAILQRYLLDEVLAPRFAAPGREITKGYTADPATIAPQVDGERYQVGLLLQPTPLTALEDLGKHGEVMPQKSTYFFPKLATGMVVNSLR